MKHKTEQKPANPFSQEPMAAPEKLVSAQPGSQQATPLKQQKPGYAGKTATGDPVAKTTQSGYKGQTAKGDPAAKTANLPAYTGATSKGDPVAKTAKTEGYTGTTAIGDPTAVSRRKGLKTVTDQ